MTIDQDTPVVASQQATDASSQEVSKPKRSTTTRSKAKPAAKPASGKTASGKAASKTSGSKPAKDSSDSKGASDSKAAQAESASSKTSASKAASTAKVAGRSAGKTAKTTTAKAKKTAEPSKEISGSAADAVAPKSAAAPAAEAPKAAGKTPGKAPAKAVGKTAGKAATPRKGKTTEASTTEAVATAKTAKTSDRSKQEAAPQKPAAKAPKGRPAKTAAESSAKATAQVAAQTLDAAPAGTAPKAVSPASDKPAVSAALTSPAPVAQAPAKAAELSAKQASEQISDKPADAARRQNAPAAERGQSPRPAADQNVSQAASQPADKAAGTPAAQAEQDAEQAAESGSASASGDAAAGDGPRRKNRRGRRGGRGRNRKKELNGQDDAQTAEDQASTAPLDDDDDALDLADDAPEQASRAQDTRPQNAPRQNKPARQAKPQQQQQLNKPENGKPAEGGRSTEGNKAANADKAPTEAPKGKRRMFISVLPGEQVEVALAEDGQLLEYYLDMLHQRKIKGNIYKGVIHNIDTNLQAAFVSYGAGKNGFLQIDEVHPEYWLAHHEPSKGKKFPPIQKVLKAGQEVLVQVVKEPTGSKGAFLTTWLSLAGRFLVLTPGQDQIGVSRKVDDDDERSRLREMMNGIDPGQGLGVIVRTVSAGTTKTTLKNDLQYLKRVWRDIRKKATEVSAPTLIYQEPGLSERAVRDYLTEDVCEIWVDNDEVAQSVRDTVNLLFPRRKDIVRVHTDMRTPMWERFNLRRQLEQIYSREVLLPSGGRLVFDQTEALMAIDINSGKISGKGNFEAMAHKTNMEAAEAIARHLKLRDIGGQVVIDFIEMRDKKHVLEVEKTLRTAMKNDRARHDVARMSSFGLLELVRQRTGSSALAISLEPCPACGGTGMRRNIEWQALQALRELRRMISAEPKEKCVYPASPELALYLLNHKRDTLREIEQDYGKCLEIMVRP
ncbi:Rne/Rng family ribonuclease [Desulfovibrio desulfuricans]|uniref:Rne/Rng family ribonuclease n=1 Tax=Desulfovibrio desulfuricans TaxID=876 RepID=UPI001AE65D20|nr:Rne/Rng family ribonuclease [Desulfovibrio desulfuricans]QTO39899.1 Rne/Rng family ribonuclease [Desulfovibrio desulfuricans]